MIPDVCKSDRLLDTREQDLRMMDVGVFGSDGSSLSVRDCINHGSFVESVAGRKGTERFVVDVFDPDAIDEIEPTLALDLLPAYDRTFDLLADWIKPFYRPVTAYGTMPIPIGPQSIPLDVFWDALCEPEVERQFSK
jgi:hypothetical protein